MNNRQGDGKGNAGVELIEKKPRKGILWLMLTAIGLFILGLALEYLLKYWTVVWAYGGQEINGARLARTIGLRFADESLPFYSVPTILLGWMPIQTDGGILSWLRWLPLLIMFLMPVLYAIWPKKVFLIVAAVLVLLTGAETLIVGLTGGFYAFTAYPAIPYFLEGALLILMCIVGHKNGKLRLILAIASIVLCAASPFLTAILNSNLGQTLMNAERMKEKFPDYNAWGQIFQNVRYFPSAYAASFWPAFKAFSFLMYGLILFSKSGRPVLRDSSLRSE